MNRPGLQPGRFFGSARRGGREANTIRRMSRRPDEESSARRAALGGAAAGLALAAALLLPAFLSGGALRARRPRGTLLAHEGLHGGARRPGPSRSGTRSPAAESRGSPSSRAARSIPETFRSSSAGGRGVPRHRAPPRARGRGRRVLPLGAGRPRTASILAGALYAGGGAYLSLVPVYNNAATGAWLPWICLRLARGGRTQPGLGLAVAAAGAPRRRLLAIAGCAGASAAALFAGAEGERIAGSSARAGLAAQPALPLLLGVALSAAALLPFAA